MTQILERSYHEEISLYTEYARVFETHSDCNHFAFKCSERFSRCERERMACFVTRKSYTICKGISFEHVAFAVLNLNFAFSH